MAATRGTFAVIWAYRTRSGVEGAFERLYGPDGGWARLFERAEGYVETELLRDVEVSGRYVTIDHWRSRPDYERFLERVPPEYAELDAAGAELTESEERIAALELVPPLS